MGTTTYFIHVVHFNEHCKCNEKKDSQIGTCFSYICLFAPFEKSLLLHPFPIDLDLSSLLIGAELGGFSASAEPIKYG